MTRINQDQIDLGSETALDLLVKSNEDKATLAATLTNKGTAANPDTETWSALLTKTADLNVEAGRALLDIPIVSRTLGILSTNNHTFCGIAHGRWVFWWINTTTLRRFDLLSAAVIPNYDTEYLPGVGTYVDISVTGVADITWFLHQDYIKNNKIYMANTTTLSIYSVDADTGNLTLDKSVAFASTLSAVGGLCGSNDDDSFFVFYNAHAGENHLQSSFVYIPVADGSINSFLSVPAGASFHFSPVLYGQDLLFGSSTISPDSDQGLRNVSHFVIDWDNKSIVDAGSGFQCNGSNSYGENMEVLISTETGSRYIPFHKNATFLYGLDDMTTTQISGALGNYTPTYNNAAIAMVTQLSDGGYVVISNYGLPIFVNADISLRYTGFSYCSNIFAEEPAYNGTTSFCPEAQIYDESNETLIAFGYAGSKIRVAKFRVYLDKVAGYTRLHNGVTTPFWVQTTDADIAAGALDKAEAV